MPVVILVLPLLKYWLKKISILPLFRLRRDGRITKEDALQAAPVAKAAPQLLNLEATALAKYLQELSVAESRARK
ncbi:MAG: hypothetical protein R2795_08390 [Saprospiraceae bacterium]